MCRYCYCRQCGGTGLAFFGSGIVGSVATACIDRGIVGNGLAVLLLDAPFANALLNGIVDQSLDARRFDDTVRRRAGERGAIMTLRDCPRAMRVVVDGIDLDDRHRFRLCEIGLAPGAGLRVMQRSAFGGRVVAFGNERVAVDGGTARAVRVRFARDEHAQDDVA